MTAGQTPAQRRHLQVNDLRACQLCEHSRVTDTGLHCACQQVAGALRLVACETARYAQGGGCGRDALHLKWARLEAPTRRIAPTLWAAA